MIKDEINILDEVPKPIKWKLVTNAHAIASNKYKKKLLEGLSSHSMWLKMYVKIN